MVLLKLKRQEQKRWKVHDHRSPENKSTKL